MRKIGRRVLGGALLAGLALWVIFPPAGFAAEPVHFKQLLSLVEFKLPGWKMSGKPSGATVKHQGFSMSEVKASYESGDKSMDIAILDFVGQSMPWLALLPQVEMENTEEYLRSTTISGFKAMEHYKFKGKQGMLNINVADRFWVQMEGDGLDNTEPLKAAARQMDLKKLATLAK